MVDLRYGLLDDFTTELHTEAVPGFASAGLGAYLPLGTNLGMVNGAVAASTSSHGSGLYVFAGWRGELGPIDLAASASRRFGQFEDLAAFTATPVTNTDQSLDSGLPQEREQISVGYYQAALQASMHVTAIHTENEVGKHSFFASADFSKQLGWDSTLFGNTYVSDAGTYGFGLGLTIPFNWKVQMSASTQYSNSHLSSVVEASHSLGDKPGSYGWRVSHGENTAAAFTSVSAAYKAAAMRAEIGGSQNGTSTGLYARADGAVVLADGDLFFGNTVNDSFAVVDAGLPGVPVLLENREIGTTGNNGKLLVPGLNAYQKNKLSLDVTRLPVTAVVTSTEMSVAPKDRAGVLADFGIRKDTSSAIVILSDAQGNLLAPGTPVTLESTKEEAVVGYDGRVFLTTLAAQNRIDTYGNIACSAEFAFAMKGDAQQVIGPVICQQAQMPQ